ncbi:MAG: ATP synthase F1 subunit epsilon [Bacteroidales bacterium]|jgi:F-type H+-transporting ATPase subunit epsilon|nr:ATP synthase F1 subunit epsilon [Bacteroidales bacterium]
MTVEIITPDKEIFSGNASLIQLPGLDGLFEILENHAPMIAALSNGRIKLVSDEKTLFFEINGGTMEVMQNKVQVLAE